MTLAAFPDAQPLAGLVGGLMIGIAGALMLLGAGRIAGVSGIVARGLGLSDGGMSPGSAWMFLLGLPLGAALAAIALGGVQVEAPPLALLLVAGLVVGFGTRLGSGCTSGHGVCGVSRLSARSIVATVTFISAGILTVFVMRLIGVVA
ncbi:MAG TPA: YeeE/YedE thiosulfate transporter family protein [Sphingomicrobium sp.]|nr:YeeE/YedE thiosulfate transporter family protein [Sphingomicrobium sp.]